MIPHQHVNMRMGFACRKVSTGFVDWAYLQKQFPLYKEQIYRLRKFQDKLLKLRIRLIAKELKHGLAR